MPAAGSNYDLAVVGSGPGGYQAAIRAAQHGMKVVVVEKDALGGICGNWGCIPTKALLRTAEVGDQIRRAGELGLGADGLRYDFQAVMQRGRKVAEQQAKGIEFLFRKNKIELVKGAAKLSKGGLSVDGKAIAAKNILLATGARPKPLPFLEHDGQTIWSYKEAMTQAERPATLIIIGAGAIGVEFAYFYNALGTKVTLLEALPAVLPVEDEEVSLALQKSLAKQGIEISTGVNIDKVEKGPPVRVALEGKTIEAERCLLATGVRGNVEGLGLEEVGVAVERGFIKVDPSYRTSVANIYAIGDVIGPPMLAHKASAEGIACVDELAGKKPKRPGAIPGCTYCHPEVGSVGLTEKQAHEKNLKFKVGRFPFRASGKARAANEMEGFVKVLVGEPHGEILGAHILGGASTDMIATLTLAITAELTADEILATVFAHPTFAEAMKGAVEDAYGEAIDL